MNRFLSCALAATVAIASGACSSSTEPTPTTGGSSGTQSTSGSSGETPTPDPTAAPTNTAPAPTPPKSPTISMVMKMTGGLHVMWTNGEKACDTIEGERKANASDGTEKAAYAVVFTVPGEADNKHDATATAALKYTYRLRCKKGGTYSAYSNEMSGTPQ